MTERSLSLLLLTQVSVDANVHYQGLSSCHGIIWFHCRSPWTDTRTSLPTIRVSSLGRYERLYAVISTCRVFLFVDAFVLACLDKGSKLEELVTEIRVRKGLKPEIPPLDTYYDRCVTVLGPAETANIFLPRL